MILNDLADKKVGILGFGQEGQAVSVYLNKHGIQAQVFENLGDGPWPAEISECQVLFRSPGIWRNHPQLLSAEKSGSAVTSQVKWFFDNSPARIIGVTGTKGKGTTCSLIHSILEKAGIPARLTGNIGKIQPLDFMDDLTSEDWIIYELSSFQLQDLTKSPHIGVCLMVTSDHLNHHNDIDEYHQAKSAVTAFQSAEDIAIYNTDYAASERIGSQGKGIKLTISASEQSEKGAYIQGDIVHITTHHHKTFVLDCSARKLKGAHNMENIAAGALVTAALDIDSSKITEAINAFNGLEHRLQFVAEVDGIQFYNDSISTIPETTVAAIDSFDRPIHLLLGGSDKGLDYGEMISKLDMQYDRIAGITLLGEVGETIADQFASRWRDKLIGPFKDFQEAMTETVEHAKSGEIILLSPGSASFGMFKNYADRGEQFTKFVQSYRNKNV